MNAQNGAVRLSSSGQGVKWDGARQTAVYLETGIWPMSSTAQLFSACTEAPPASAYRWACYIV